MKRKYRELKITTEATDKEWEEFLKLVDDIEAENRVKIEFKHQIYNQKNWGNKMGQGKVTNKPQSFTECIVESKEFGGKGTALCHPDDNFDRRKGRLLAFERAIERMSKEHKRLCWEEFKRKCPKQFSK